MNKRQAKKYRSKVVYPIIDEFNLLTLNQEEREKAIKDKEKSKSFFIFYELLRSKNNFIITDVKETWKEDILKLAEKAGYKTNNFDLHNAKQR